jgi:hypothetical protein
LRGAPGVKGPTGSEGETGDAGPPGPTGPAGDPGPPANGGLSITPYFYKGEEDALDVELGDLSKVIDIHKRLQHLKSPKGTRDSPARSCLDLKLENPDMNDGYYWIDPNGGCINDAVKVFCNFSSGEIKTCIHPVNDHSQMQSWRSGESIWFSNFNKGFQLSYSIPKSQLKFIKIGSRYASQHFTYNCRNTEASLLFRTQDNKEIKPTDITHDGCQGKPSYSAFTELQVNTRRIAQLPLKDFAVVDYGSVNQEFGFKMGPACFY